MSDSLDRQALHGSADADREPVLLAARFVFPIDTPPIQNGAVRFASGRVVEVGTLDQLGGRAHIDFGDAAILPGLVNAHTHLELSHLLNRLDVSGGFAGWLPQLVTLLRQDPPSPESTATIIERGLHLSLREGVTTLGDITRMPEWTRPCLAHAGQRIVSYGEVIAIGSLRDRLCARLDAAASRAVHSDRLTVGISPHAPYTVEPEAMRACALRAAAAKLPICMHLSETRDEEQFTRTRTGAFADYLQALGVWDEDIPVSNCSPVALADRTGVLTPHSLIAHGNYVHPEEYATLAGRGVSVAYCPRTHHAFGHGPHPFLDMIAAGINVCLGTDSLASAPSLSILDELRFLHEQRPDIPSHLLLRMATANGAKALGFDRLVGSLAPGRWADLFVLPVGRNIDAVNVLDSLLESHSSPAAVYIAGRPALRA